MKHTEAKGKVRTQEMQRQNRHISRPRDYLHIDLYFCRYRPSICDLTLETQTRKVN